jgi:hypothetical protein
MSALRIARHSLYLLAKRHSLLAKRHSLYLLAKRHSLYPLTHLIIAIKRHTRSEE